MTTTHLATLADLYTSRSATYDNSWHPTFALYMLQTALTSASPLPPDPILLDLACGTGLLTIPAVQHLPSDATIIGVDISPGMLREARTKLSALPPREQKRVMLIEHDMVNLESVPALAELAGKVDIVTCASAFVLLANATEREAALVQWTRMLKPATGRLVFDVTHEHNLRSGVVMERVLQSLGLRGPSERLWIRGRESVIELIETVGGLDVESIELKEQAGEGVVKMSAGADVAVTKFEYLLQTGAFDVIREAEDGVEVQARELFVKFWAEAAGSDGMVEKVDGVYIVVAKRKSEKGSLQ
jgi:ubiquinone/menaquinone biosynthesis C-methylase UbiE